MTACNARPPAGDPFAGSGVACHFPAGHDGPHAWSIEAAQRDQKLLRTIADVAAFIVDQDLADVPAERRLVVVGHLTGALFVRIREDDDRAQRYRAALAQIADEESGIWGTIAQDALR
jgi:hypothetical protein